MSNEDGSPTLSEAQIQKIVHDYNNREQAKDSIRNAVERVLCEFADVRYDAMEMSHRKIMVQRGVAIARMMREQEAEDKRREDRQEWRQERLKTIWDKTVSTVTGLLLLLGLGWIAAKLGIKLPGAG